MRRDPVENLVAATHAIAQGRPLDAEAAEWFLVGTRRALARAERLDQGLGLGQTGRWRLQGLVAKLARNLHLTEAAAGITFDPNATTYQRAARLAEQIEAFLTDDWPRARVLAMPPKSWAPWRVHLWHAARSDLGLPRDVRHLQRILAEPPPFSRPNDTAEHLRSLLLLGDPCAL
jgi:hypothetical protein